MRSIDIPRFSVYAPKQESFGCSLSQPCRLSARLSYAGAVLLSQSKGKGHEAAQAAFALSIAQSLRSRAMWLGLASAIRFK